MTFLRVIHSGAVDIVHDGQLLDILGVGDTFGHGAMLSGLPPGFEARAAEDTLCYRIGARVARPLLDRARDRELRVGVQEPAHQPVVTLLRATTVRVEPMTSIREAARQMTRHAANAAIVDLRGGGFGIVTDRDIRSRIVAAGVPLSAPVASVMTTPAFSVGPARLGGEVLFEMLERGIRHALVVNERGELVGVVEDSDLFGVQPHSWFGARRSIARAQTVEALAAVSRLLPEIVADLHASNLRALEIARVLSALADALTVRAIELAAPPRQLPADGLVWVALGSQSRREMTPASTARGALICSEPPPDGWTEAVSEALRSCGLTGAVVARSQAEWGEPRGDDELSLTVLMERRVLWGTPREPLPIARGDVRERVLAALAGRALAYSPPTGFDADRVLEVDGTRSDVLDIRRAAVIPVVELARWAGAAAGVVEGSTPERLRAAAGEGVLAAGDAETLVEAFELALELRIGHHMQQLARGAAPDDRIEATEISPLTRTTCATCSGRSPPSSGGFARERPLVRPRAQPEGVAAAFADAGRPSGRTPWREARWCALDLELTGLDPNQDEIVAIGAVPIEDGRLILADSMYTLVRTSRRSEHDAVLMHKLRVADLADAPPLQRAAEMVMEVLAGRVPVFHTGWVETTFLAPLFSAAHLRFPAAATPSWSDACSCTSATGSRRRGCRWRGCRSCSGSRGRRLTMRWRTRSRPRRRSSRSRPSSRHSSPRPSGHSPAPASGSAAVDASGPSDRVCQNSCR